MEYSRRDFLRNGSLAAGTLIGGGLQGAPARLPKAYFGLNPIIENNPKAVFICRTKVPHKMHEESKRAAGLKLAREIFVPMDGAPGIPVSHRVVLKPNVCSVRNNRPHVENWGTGTDPQFYEGMVTGLKELGLGKFTFVEANNFNACWEMAVRLDVVLNMPYRKCRMDWHRHLS